MELKFTINWQKWYQKRCSLHSLFLTHLPSSTLSLLSNRFDKMLMSDKNRSQMCIVSNLNFKNKFEVKLYGYRIFVAASLLRSVLVLRRILKLWIWCDQHTHRCFTTAAAWEKKKSFTMKNYLFLYNDLNCKFLTFGYKIEIRFFFIFFLPSQLEKRKKNGRNFRYFIEKNWGCSVLILTWAIVIWKYY